MRPGEQPGKLSPHLQVAALDAGLTRMRRPDRRPNSLRVLQAIEHCKAFEAGDAIRDAFYVAYWEENKDVGSLEVIREIVERHGVEWAPLELALSKNLYLDTVMEEFQDGMDNGFDGIPAFIVGDVKFTGAQPMELFRKVAERAKSILEQDPKAFERIKRVL